MNKNITFAALAFGATLLATAAFAADTMAPTGNTMKPAGTMAPTNTMAPAPTMAPTAGGMMAPHKPAKHKAKPPMAGGMGAMHPANTMAPAGTMKPANTMGGTH